jgi:hypothetical protein
MTEKQTQIASSSGYLLCNRPCRVDIVSLFSAALAAANRLHAFLFEIRADRREKNASRYRCRLPSSCCSSLSA